MKQLKMSAYSRATTEGYNRVLETLGNHDTARGKGKLIRFLKGKAATVGIVGKV